MVLVEKLYAHLGVAELYTNRGREGAHCFTFRFLPLASINQIRRIIYYMITGMDGLVGLPISCVNKHNLRVVWEALK